MRLRQRTGDDRLDVLLIDYAATRDDERVSVSVQASFAGFAITVLGLLGAALAQTQREDATWQIEDPILAAAPAVPLTLMIFMTWLGARNTLRTYYLRALEAELQRYAQPPLITAAGISPASMFHLISTVESVVRGRLGLRLLLGLLYALSSMAVVGIAIYIGLHISDPYPALMSAIYGPIMVLLFSEMYALSIAGRSLWLKSIDQVRKGQSQLPRKDQRRTERSLVSYLMLPRPEDTIKWLIAPGAFLVAAWQLESFDRWPQLLFVLAVLEILIYSARYQWNDARDATVDKGHTSQAERRRLPHGDDLRVNLVWSLSVAALRVVTALIIGLAFGMVVEAMLLTGLVFAIALPYEWLKATNSTDRPFSHATARSKAIWAVVGLGYGVRGAAGFAAAGLPLDQAPALIGIAGLVTFGATFVLLTWVLEAASLSYRPKDAMSEDTEVEWMSHALLERKKTHVAVLLKYAGYTVGPVSQEPCDYDEERRAGRGDGCPTRVCKDAMVVAGRSKIGAPWDLAALLALSLAGAFGMALALDDPVGGSALSGAGIGALTGLVLAIVSSTRARCLVLPLAGGSLFLLAQTLGASHAALAMSPLLAFAIVIIGFRASSYNDLKHPLRGPVASLTTIGMSVLPKLLGEETYRRAGFEREASHAGRTGHDARDGVMQEKVNSESQYEGLAQVGQPEAEDPAPAPSSR